MTTVPKITPEMIRLYDEYTHITLDRRGFLAKLTNLAGSSAAAAAILSLLENNYAQAALVAADDPRIQAQTVKFPSPNGEISGYLAKPANAGGKLPAVVVVHEIAASTRIFRTLHGGWRWRGSWCSRSIS